MTIRTITPLRDAYISEFYPNQNFGGSSFLYISQYRQIGDDYRSLLQFSLGSIPAGRRIVSARLQLTVYRNEIPSGRIIRASLRRALQSWRESTVTWNNQPSTRFISSFRISSARRPGSTITIDVTALVRRWYSGQTSNLGIMLRGNEVFNSLVGFYSSESSRAPKLIVNYVRR
ncbi:hypothetical protein ASZ90_019091 [hydrocarbon metagenome]|uniref:Carbohydrate-binding module family 96 domain-containing protein n=1 Tax=hydrocarbon metagenome TaxID=938273 RepID=A0A0W8E4X4_9ZZZZ